MQFHQSELMSTQPCVIYCCKKKKKNLGINDTITQAGTPPNKLINE